MNRIEEYELESMINRLIDNDNNQIVFLTTFNISNETELTFNAIESVFRNRYTLLDKPKVGQFPNDLLNNIINNI